MKKNLFLLVVRSLQPAVRSLQLRTFIIIIIFLFSFVNSLHAQYWHYYNPTLFFDVNAVDIIEPGLIVVGGGWETNDSVQVMFQTTDYGQTWCENAHDGPAPWNKSIAFSDSLNGYAVGYSGRIIKSNDAGKNWGYPVTPINRDLNKIFYAGNGTYYVVGGNKANDSMQTILKSTNYGNTWTVIYDTLGSWLKSIFFINALKGYAVGDNGVILMTSNGGNSWANMVAPIQRDFNAITFINADTGYIVGGIPLGLCRRTILRTINGGANWSVFLDITGGALKDISFADPLNGFIVGDSATVLKTNDGGLYWLPVTIDSNLTGNESFNAVKFENCNFGVVGGKSGVLYVYYNPYPLVHTLMSTDITSSTARLNGSLDADGVPTAVYFDYGTTTAYGNEIAAVPDSSSVTGNVNVFALPAGLIPNTTYHFRIKAKTSVVTNYGNDEAFFTGNPEIPNFDFEMWTLNTSVRPSGWDAAVGIVSPYTPACHNNSAVKIMNDTANAGMMGGILFGSSNDQGHTFIGGTPFNARPDTLIGCFNYNIPYNDTALILLILKKQGIIISNNLFKIYGNSMGNYNNLKFPVSYNSSGNADSLIIVIIVTDFRHMSHPLNPNGYLIVDNVCFTGTTESIPNNDFENWETDSLFTLNNWFYKYKSYLHFPVSRTADAQNGHFAVLLHNFLGVSDSTYGELSTGDSQILGNGFSVNTRHKTLTGYYKFLPENNDTLNIMVSMFKNHNFVGNSYFYTADTALDYTPFVLDINYLNNAGFSNTDIPDTCMIVIKSSKGKTRGNSIAYIDNLNFDGFLAGVKEPALTNVPDFDFNVFPNPFSEQACIVFSVFKDENIIVRLFDLSGKQVFLLANTRFTAGEHKLILSADGLKKGFYICIINTQNAIYSKKLIIY